ncbi:MAG: hypothetical protein RI958_1493 [Actinomycetota bacterium]
MAGGCTYRAGMSSTADTPIGVFLSKSVWDDFGEPLRAVDGIEPLVFVPGEHVDRHTIERIEVASLSSDLWPDWSAPYMRVCLDAPNLRWMHSFSAGVDHPVWQMFLDRGVRLTNSSGAGGTSIAHHVILQLLAMRRDLPAMLRAQARHEWTQRNVGDVENTLIGVLGMGPIGSETARIAAAFGVRVIGMRRRVTGDEPCETWTLDRLHELLPMVDALVLALPLTPDTRRLIGPAEFALLRPGAHFVNVGRGELVDEPALIEALRSGRVGYASLDVTEVEPLDRDSALWDMPNVIITPHSSGSTRSNRERAMGIFLDNLRRFADDTPLHNEIERA